MTTPLKSGDVVWNPLTGEKAMLLESPKETNGARLVTQFVVEEGGFVPGGEHRHNHCTEYFSIEQGEITFLVNGDERTLGPGDELVVEPGSWHRWWNSGDGEVRAKVRVEPALRFDEMILSLWGLCADGYTDAKGSPSPLLGAIVARRYRHEIELREPPAIVQRVLFAPLAAVGGLLGRGKLLERYLDPETHPTVEPGKGRLPERVIRPRPPGSSAG